MEKDANCRESENYRENYPTVLVDSLGLHCLLFVIEDCRHQNCNQRKENKQGADKKENIDSRHVRQAWQLAIHGKAICDKRRYFRRLGARRAIGYWM